MKKSWPAPIERGYINIYSKLRPQELRQIFYSREYKKINPSWDDTMILLAHEFGLAAKTMGKKVRVFDAGCGNGNYAIEENSTLINLAWGMDVKPELTKKNRILDEIKYGNLETIPYPDKRFYIAFSLWVLEHLENPEKVFQEIHRVLRPDGIFIFATPNKNSLLLRIKRLLGNRQLISFV